MICEPTCHYRNCKHKSFLFHDSKKCCIAVGSYADNAAALLADGSESISVASASFSKLHEVLTQMSQVNCSKMFGVV